MQEYAWRKLTWARDAMMRHFRHNRLENISVFGYALGDFDGTCEFQLSSQLGRSSRFVNQEAAPTVVSRVEVPVRSFDGLLGWGQIDIDIKRMTFIKIDVEGSEPLVLRGMRKTLKTADPLVWIEINHGSLNAAGFSARDVEKELALLGFGVFLPDFHRRLPQSRMSFERISDIESEVLGNIDVAAFKEGGQMEARLFGKPISIR